MDLTQIINSLAPLVALLLGTGAFVKYMPFLKKVSNQVIPLLNAVIAFFALFGATPAHASIFGTVAHAFGLPGQMLVALLISGLTSRMHDTVFKEVLDEVIVPALTPQAKQ